jgi:hypothetical protein
LLVPVIWNEAGTRPESESAAVTVATCIILPFGDQSVQPAAGIPEINGGVLSMLTIAFAGELIFPALSVQVPETDWPAPSAVKVIGTVQEAIPESASAPVKDTVTFVLFQPRAFGTGTIVSVAVGGVSSIATVKVLGVSWLPALSVPK